LENRVKKMTALELAALESWKNSIIKSWPNWMRMP
jgi:hypothetical protein